MSQQKRITEQKGITLISLVITIVILLILAGVAISINVGPDGLFSKAQQAKEDWNSEVANEEIEINKWLEHEVITGIKQTTDEDATTIAQKDDNTYLVQSIEDLVLLSKAVNTGTTYEGKTFEIEANLSFTSEKSYVDPTAVNFAGLGDINGNGTNEELMVELTTGKGFIPIGNGYDNSFRGTLEGNNKTIDGLLVQGRTYIGFIGYAMNANIKNISLTKVNLQPGGYIGAMVAYSEKSLTLDNISCDGIIVGTNASYTGGIVGYASCYQESNSPIQIKNCTNKAEITGYSRYGGIVGYITYTGNILVENCKNQGKITSSYIYNAGGIIGEIAYTMAGEIKILNSSNEAEVIVRGGILGYCSSTDGLKLTMDNCYNIGDIPLNNVYVEPAGGLLGDVSASEITVTNCYNKGNITITNTASDYIGGIAGDLGSGNVKIAKCYNTGNIKIQQDRVGGILGCYSPLSATATAMLIEECYNTGDIQGRSKIGGICGDADFNGYKSEAFTTIKNCYNTGNINETRYSSGPSGGIVGSFAKKIINCYNTGNITWETSEYGYKGGVIGQGASGSDEHIIENVYNTGSLSGTMDGRGGIIGKNASMYTLKNAYNFGMLETGSSLQGGGAISGSKCASTTNCYYLTGTYPYGIYNEDTPDTPDNSGEKSETDIKALMNTNLVSLEEWEAGPDGYPVLSCFKTAE